MPTLLRDHGNGGDVDQSFELVPLAEQLKENTELNSSSVQTKICVNETVVGCRVPSGLTQMKHRSPDRKETPKEKRRRLERENRQSAESFKRFLCPDAKKPPAKEPPELDPFGIPNGGPLTQPGFRVDEEVPDEIAVAWGVPNDKREESTQGEDTETVIEDSSNIEVVDLTVGDEEKRDGSRGVNSASVHGETRGGANLEPPGMVRAFSVRWTTDGFDFFLDEGLAVELLSRME